MKYLAALIIPFFIMSCALEKESTDQVNGVFNFTTASVKIDSVTNGSKIYAFPPACINFINGSGVIKYTIKSNGHYGTSDVDSIIRDSELRFVRARLYFNDIPIDITLPQNIKYNNTLTSEIALTQSDARAAGLTDGTYSLEIEMVASEYNGNGSNTVLNNTFSGYFGNVTLDFIGSGCQ